MNLFSYAGAFGALVGTAVGVALTVTGDFKNAGHMFAVTSFVWALAYFTKRVKK